MAVDGKSALNLQGATPLAPAPSGAKRRASLGVTVPTSFSAFMGKLSKGPAKSAAAPSDAGTLGVMGPKLQNPQPAAPAVQGKISGRGRKAPSLPAGTASMQEARNGSQAAMETLARQGLSAKPKSAGRTQRISGSPVTGRMGIGMEDTRKSGGAGRSTLIGRSGLGMSRTGSLAAQIRGNAAAQEAPKPAAAGDFSMHTLYDDLKGASNPNVLATLSKVMDSSHTGTAGVSAGSVRGVNFLQGDEAVLSSLRTQSHKRQNIFSGQSAVLTQGTSFGAGRSAQGEMELGALAAKFESGSDGISAIGYDRHGGTSYGKYQISSRAGTMKNFIGYLEEKAPDLAKRLQTAGPANTGGRRGGMPAEWKKIAAENPERFEALQEDFIRHSHFEPAMQALQENTGINPENMPPALREVVFSTAVQHGPAGAARIFAKAAEKVGPTKLAALDDPSGESSKRAGQDFIRRIYDIRKGQFVSSTRQVQGAAQSRLNREMNEALNMLT